MRTVTEMFIRVMIVVGLYTFIGNSGVISFGHIGFMCLGAYATAWFTIPPAMKRFSLRGLPDIIAHNQLPFPVLSGAGDDLHGRDRVCLRANLDAP